MRPGKGGRRRGAVKIYELAKTVQLFERAAHDEGLRGAVPPIVVASFGVFPLGLSRGRLTLACPEWVRGPLLSILEAGLEAEVEPLYFEKEIILGYITKVYLQDGMVNVNTFSEKDFLRESNFPFLFREKEDGPAGCENLLPPHLLLTLDVSFRSTLRNLDRKEGYPFFAAESLDVPFSRNGRGLVVHSGPVDPGTFCLVKRSNLYAGVENRHGYAEHRVDALPFDIHPTEVQLRGVDAAGRVELSVLEETKETGPGERAAYRCSYHFLHFGNRYRRDIELRVHEAALWEREAIRYGSCQPRWSVEDLDRWLGLDWAAG